MSKRIRKVDNNIPENAKRILKEKKIKLGNTNYKREKKTKYTKERLLRVSNGYDCLENLLVVRTYMYKRYNISLHLLEVLLYLAPKNYFTLDDYYEMPKQFTFNSIKYLLEKKYISIISKGKDKSEHIYHLSIFARNIVVKFYKHLSGEEPIPETQRQRNPMAKNNASAYDKMKLNIIKKINSLPISETKKGLFE